MRLTHQWPDLIVRDLGVADYQTTFEAMKTLTDTRDDATPDELWLLEHHPVYTQGLNGKAEHILNPGKIPVVKVDRGGQVTYHGPGQLVGYLMINLKRRNLGVRALVTLIETSLVDCLKQEFNLDAYAKPDAPGVYVDQKKIASLGLRVRRGCSYHGLSLNNHMDLAPFFGINPCGYEGLEMTQLSDYISPMDIDLIKPKVESYILKHLGYTIG